MDAQACVGVDVGGTLIKIVRKTARGLKQASFPVHEAQAAVSWINQQESADGLCLTGGMAHAFARHLKGVKIAFVPEFEAACSGARFLLNEQQKRAPESFILTSVGTGTSIHLVKEKTNERIIGTGVGGGTLIGLSGLLSGVFDFEKLMKLAATGKRDRVDLTVAHIYGEEEPPIPGDLTASNFGLLTHTPRKPVSVPDQLAAVIGLVAETVASMSIQAGERFGVRTIVFVGSAFVHNPLMGEMIINYCRFCGMTPIIPKGGQYSGAIGALMKSGGTF